MKIALFLLAAILLHAPARAQAVYEQSYNSHIELHNEVEYHTIPIYELRQTLRVWTDSYSGGANFDPIIAVWHNGLRIAMNDDNPNINGRYQSQRDAGLLLPTLPWGSYVVTVSAYPNFPISDRIGDGVTYDAQTPIPIDTWCQPGDPGPGCHVDRHLSLHWTVE
jgi:hypothetical protein